MDFLLSSVGSVVQTQTPSSPQAAGMITAFAGSTAPAGWALCDGAAVSRDSYAQLFARVGTAWGVGDGSTTFNLPDLRGSFLRGASPGTREVGTSQEDATAANGLTVTGNGAHYHTGRTGTEVDIDGLAAGGTGVGYWHPSLSGNLGSGSSNGLASGTHKHDFTTSTDGHSHGISGDTETRPANKGVNYLIKLYDDAGPITMSGAPFVGSEFQPAPIAITEDNDLEFSRFYTCNDGIDSVQTLPAATGSNKVITVENTGLGDVSVVAQSAETINGASGQIIGQYQSIKIRDYSAGKWVVMH